MGCAELAGKRDTASVAVVAIGTNDEHDELDDNPDVEREKKQSSDDEPDGKHAKDPHHELDNTLSGITQVEVVHAPRTEEEAQQQSSDPGLLLSIAVVLLLVLLLTLLLVGLHSLLILRVLLVLRVRLLILLERRTALLVALVGRVPVVRERIVAAVRLAIAVVFGVRHENSK